MGLGSGADSRRADDNRRGVDRLLVAASRSAWREIAALEYAAAACGVATPHFRTRGATRLGFYLIRALQPRRRRPRAL